MELRHTELLQLNVRALPLAVICICNAAPDAHQRPYARKGPAEDTRFASRANLFVLGRDHREIELTAELADEEGRFEALLRGRSHLPWDQALLERADWIIAPTLGAIIPGWLLLIPRRRALSFRDLATTGYSRPEALMGDVLKHLGLQADEVIWFEHGPAMAGTAIGCGLDHAHIHLLVHPPFSFADFERKARSLGALNWTAIDAKVGYSAVESYQSYLIAGCGEDAVFANGVESAGSQFLRRVVAALVGETESWDYQRSPFIQNVLQTIATFRTLEGHARYGG